MNSKVIAICLAKGGVGKSSCAINLGAALADSGRKILLVDCDGQRGNMTLKLGRQPDDIRLTLANMIIEYLEENAISNPEKYIISVSDKIDLIPANPKLNAVQNRLITEKTNALLDENMMPTERVLREILNPLRQQYQTIIIDTSPSISMLAINALAAADSVLVPVEAHYESYEALIQTLDVIKRIRANLNPSLTVEGILVTKYQSRTSLCRNIKEMVTNEYGQSIRVFGEPVPYSIKAAEQAVHGLSIFEYAPDTAVAAAYKLLAKEVLAHA